MTSANSTRARRRRRLRLISPLGMVSLAALMAAGFALCHALGWRRHVAALLGTSLGAADQIADAGLGGFYAMTYFLFVFVAPVLAIAAALFAVVQRLWRARAVPREKPSQKSQE